MKTRHLRGKSARIAAGEFLPLAQRYCDWLEQAAKGPVGNSQLLDLHILLAELQAAAAGLPSKAVGDESAESVDHDNVEGVSTAKASWDLAHRAAERLPVGAYSVVFDALDESDRGAIMTTLEDDLGDIHSDLKRGMSLFKSGRFSDAVWEWSFSYWNHWGRHAVHAQTAPWAHLAAGNYFD
jgi:hypothetical protein